MSFELEAAAQATIATLKAKHEEARLALNDPIREASKRIDAAIKEVEVQMNAWGQSKLGTVFQALKDVGAKPVFRLERRVDGGWSLRVVCTSNIEANVGEAPEEWTAANEALNAAKQACRDLECEQGQHTRAVQDLEKNGTKRARELYREQVAAQLAKSDSGQQLLAELESLADSAFGYASVKRLGVSSQGG